MRYTNYDEVAPTYDRRYLDEDYELVERALFEFIGPNSRRVLEVGCGTGHWLHRLQNSQIEAIGIDPSDAMLSHARRKMPCGRLIRGRAEALPFEVGRFDRLFYINAFHHVADKRRAIEEARRVLRAGGTMLTIGLDPHTGIDRWWIYDYFPETLEIDKQRYPSCEQTRAFMHAAGFVDARSREVLHFPEDMLATEAFQKDIITPAITSQLAVLTSGEFAAGVARIRTAIAKDGTTRLSANLHAYATYAVAS
jgi:ubiquinone/menaquinone biosynthesis C-methylase UbiE